MPKVNLTKPQLRHLIRIVEEGWIQDNPFPDDVARCRRIVKKLERAWSE